MLLSMVAVDEKCVSYMPVLLLLKYETIQKDDKRRYNDAFKKEESLECLQDMQTSNYVLLVLMKQDEGPLAASFGCCWFLFIFFIRRYTKTLPRFKSF